MSVLIFTDNPNTGETQLVRRELVDRGIDIDYKAPWDISLPDYDPDYDLCTFPATCFTGVPPSSCYTGS